MPHVSVVNSFRAGVALQSVQNKNDRHDKKTMLAKSVCLVKSSPENIAICDGQRLRELLRKSLKQFSPLLHHKVQCSHFTGNKNATPVAIVAEPSWPCSGILGSEAKEQGKESVFVLNRSAPVGMPKKCNLVSGAALIPEENGNAKLSKKHPFESDIWTSRVGLMNLPNEMILTIADYLPLKDLRSLKKVNPELNRILNGFFVRRKKKEIQHILSFPLNESDSAYLSFCQEHSDIKNRRELSIEEKRFRITNYLSSVNCESNISSSKLLKDLKKAYMRQYRLHDEEKIIILFNSVDLFKTRLVSRKK